MDNALPVKRMVESDESSRFFMLTVLANIITQFAFSLIFGWLLEPQYLKDHFATTALADQFVTNLNIAGSFLIQGVYVALYFILIHNKKKTLRFKLQSKLTPVNALLAVALGALLLLALYLPTFWVDILIGLTGYTDPALTYNALSITLGSILFVLVAPFVEELIFRGVIFSGVSRSKGIVKAAFLTALAFMLSHMNISQTFYQFFIGVICGFITAYSGSLVSAMIVHAVSNLLAFLMQVTPLSGVIGAFNVFLTANPLYAILITLGALIVFGGLIVLIMFYLKKKSKVEPVPELKVSFAVPKNIVPADPFAPAAMPEAAAVDTVELDPKLQEMFKAAKERRARMFYWAGCIGAGVMLVLMFALTVAGIS